MSIGAGRSRALLLLVALACLVLGALAGIGITEALEDDDATSASPFARTLVARVAEESTVETDTTETTEATTATETTETETTETTGSADPAPVTEPPPAVLALMNRVPADEQPCTALQPEDADVWLLRCTPANGVVSVYVPVASTATLRAEYTAALSEAGITEGKTPTPCPNLVPSEQAITRGEVVVGRLLCEEEEGRQAILWTSEPLGALGLARAPEDMSAAALFEWWRESDRPVLSDDEVTFYARVPEGHRASCEFRFVAFSQVQAVPPPERGSTALCVDPRAGTGQGDEYLIVVYTQHFGVEAMNADYSALKSRWGVQDDTGSCEMGPAAEGVWQQNDEDAGRFACTTFEGRAVMTWTTDALNILSTAIAPPGMSVPDLWSWWTRESGPVFRSGP